jgi:hypothetical protein
MRRAASRGLTAVEIAIGVAIAGSVLAVAVPAFVRELHASRLAEPVQGLQRIGAAAVAHAEGRPTQQAFPPSAPLTPSAPPKGTPAADPPGSWDTPTWTALGFRPSAEGVPHAFAFRFDAELSPARSAFFARAHGDLDGDGALSTFEISGGALAGQPAVVAPGMYVEAELE